MSTAYDSIPSLVRTGIAARREADYVELEFLGPDTEMLHHYNPSSIRPDGRPRLTLSMYKTDGRPDGWLEVAGTRATSPGRNHADHPVPEQ